MHTSVEKVRAKLEGLKVRRAEVFHLNGRKWLNLKAKEGEEPKRVPAEFLERWIKEAEIDIGLMLGRALEENE